MQKINVRNLLRMQKTGQTIRPLHIILGNRNLEKFGEIVNIPADSITGEYVIITFILSVEE